MKPSERYRIDQTKQEYPPGTRLELKEMDDPYAPVQPGTRGTVAAVDDMGTIHMKWDNGRTLGVVPGVDQFRKLTAQAMSRNRRFISRLSGSNPWESLGGRMVSISSLPSAVVWNSVMAYAPL